MASGGQKKMKLLSFEQLQSIVKEQQIPLVTHSKNVSKGCVFVALPPSLPMHKVDEAHGGEQFIEAVLQAGVKYIVLAKKHASLIEIFAQYEAFAILVSSTRKALGKLSAHAYGTDTSCPYIAGITGTNGKTTETYLLEHLFMAMGEKVGILGTVEYRWPGKTIPAPLTTPSCVELHSMLAQMRDSGVSKVFMEVSSHAIDQERIAGIPYSAALFTNLTQDHLDYHKDMDDYFSAKSRLFLSCAQGGIANNEKVGAVNADDEYGRKLLLENRNLVGFGLAGNKVQGTRHLAGRIVSMSPKGMQLEMEYETFSWKLESKLVGSFNAMNLLGVQALCLSMGIPHEKFSLLSSFAGVPGRLERIENTRGVHAFVDYAHTPDALIKAQAALREAGFKRLVTVFGCGGNRDKTKRPLMGQAVASGSDIAVLTSDNPRHEDPLEIMRDIRPGLVSCKDVYEYVDRKIAIKEAIALLEKDDALLVAGKGHETYQQIGDEKKPFSDQRIIKEYLS